MSELTISCPAGRITGVIDRHDDGDVATFHSVPFAHFPGPFDQSVPLWLMSDADKATSDGKATSEIDARQPRPDDVALTITTPADARNGSDYPVIVYIHGGRFETGTHEDPRADGTYNARHGIVQVQLGYRVGLEGFARFKKDEPHRYRGIDDCQIGLEWIQRNIESFGGDPTNVTIIGQSAGATTALWLARRDHYRGAFRRIIALSPCYPRASFEERKGTLRTILGKPITHSSLTKLAETKPAKLKKAYKRFRTVYSLDMALGPAPLDCRQLADVPIIMSSTLDEYYDMPSAKRLDDARNPKRVTKLLSRFMGLDPSRFDYWWNAATPTDPQRPGSRFIGDAQTRRWVSQVVNHAPGKTWLMEFRNSQGHALHCADLRYVFGVHAQKNPDSESGHAAAAINDLVRRFVTTGDPGWDEYRLDNQHPCMVIDMASGDYTVQHGTLDYVANAFPPIEKTKPTPSEPN